MKKIWINKTNSFQEKEKFEQEYYFSMSSRERLSTVQFCREQYYKMNREQNNEGRKRLRRVIRVVKQA